MLTLGQLPVGDGHGYVLRGSRYAIAKQVARDQGRHGHRSLRRAELQHACMASEQHYSLCMFAGTTQPHLTTQHAFG